MPRSLRTLPRSPRGRTALALGLTGAMGLSVVSGVNASSHREAPMISQDAVADNTDVYAFTSAGDTVTLIANWVPNQEAGAGPNYFRFGEDVLYSIHIDNDGDAVEDVTYEWRFRNEIVNPDTFLYATGPITSLDDENYNLRQRYDVFEVRDGQRRQLLGNAIMPPSNVGPASTPDFASLAQQGIYDLQGAEGQTFAGQRDDAFFADIASIFDLGQLRPFLPNYQPLTRDAQEGVDTFAGVNVHTTSIQVPISDLTDGDPVIGIWSTASRSKVRVFQDNAGANVVNRGRFVQISRLGNPLVNEVVIPLGLKDTFNSLEPSQDAAALSTEDGSIPLVQDPELAGLITALYGIETPPSPRNDLVSVFLTGIEGVNQPQQDDNFVPAELLRLNTDTAPEDVAWPNGRRLEDDVIDTALRAVAGGYALTPDFNMAPNNQLADGVAGNDQPFLDAFPFQGTPWQGYGENNDLRGKQTTGADTAGQPSPAPSESPSPEPSESASPEPSESASPEPSESNPLPSAG